MDIFNPVVKSLQSIVDKIYNFIPGFINGLIILIIGYFICMSIRWAIRLLLRQLHFEALVDRVGINNAIRGLGVRAPLSEIIAQTIFFFLFLSFAQEAVGLMGLAAVVQLIKDILVFIPRAISAIVLLIFGSMLGRFLGDTVAGLADNYNIRYSGALGRIIQYAVVAFMVVLALSTLGVDTTILINTITIIIGSFGLAIALTFGLGARESARNVIAGYYVRQRFQPGQQVTFANHSGKVRSTAGAYTVVDIANKSREPHTLSLPNSLLLQYAIPGSEPTDETATIEKTKSPSPSEATPPDAAPPQS